MKQCPKCGKMLNDSMAFCTQCGTPLANAATQPAPQPPVWPASQPTQSAPRLAQQPTQQHYYAPANPVLNTVKQMATSPLFLAATAAQSGMVLFNIIASMAGTSGLLGTVGTYLSMILRLGGYSSREASGLLDGIKVRLNTDYQEHKSELDALADKVVYTGPIDAYFDYKLGTLEYRSVRFETELLDQPNFQGNAAVNYTDRETQWTRIIEHKWFEFGKDENGNDLPKTIISREYSSEWKPGDEPYYPVNDAKNSLLYSEYKKLADAENKVIFGGRLGEYKYYDMDQVIAAVLEKCEKEFVGENV